MKTRTIGIILNGVTGRMGTTSTWCARSWAIIAQGGVRLSDTRASCRSRSSPAATPTSQELAERQAADELHHRPRTAACRPGERNLLRRLGTLQRFRPSGRVTAEDHLLRRSRPPRRRPRRCAREAVRGRRGEERRGAGQALAARACARSRLARGLLRKILSVRGEFGYWVFTGHSRPARPAAELELPQRRRRRHHHRHVLPLAVRHQQPVRRRSSRSSPRQHRPARARRTRDGKPYKATADDSAYAHLPARRRHGLPVQLELVHAASGATTC